MATNALSPFTILGLVWLDHAATRRVLIGLLRQTVAAAARSNRAAAAVAEWQLAARLLDNARQLTLGVSLQFTDDRGNQIEKMAQATVETLP